MTPDERFQLERGRFAKLSLLRAAGVVVMLLGMGLWFGNLTADGETVGPLVFSAGLIASLVLPHVLVRRWRTPPRP